MQYIIQTSLAELEAACVNRFDGVQLVKAWTPHGGGLYIGHYAGGQGVISGPILVGQTPWIEIQFSHPELKAELEAIGMDAQLMKDELRTNPPLRAAYKRAGRKRLRNKGGKAVGICPLFMIRGRDVGASFLAGEELEEAEELSDLEDEE